MDAPVAPVDAVHNDVVVVKAEASDVVVDDVQQQPPQQQQPVPAPPPPPPPAPAAGSENLLQLEAQSLTISADFEAGRLTVMAELTFLTSVGPDGTLAEGVSLTCSPQCAITGVQVNSRQASFWRNRKQTLEVDESNPKGIRAELLEPDWQPQLIVSFPADVLNDIRQTHDVGTDTKLVVEITYTLTESTAGVHFVKSSPLDRDYSQVYSQTHNSPAWLWVPCIMQSWARCRWTVVIVAAADHEVACSGELTTSVDAANGVDRIYTYKLDRAYDANAVAFVIGRTMVERSMDTSNRFVALLPAESTELFDEQWAKQFSLCYDYLHEFLGGMHMTKTCTVAWVAHAPLSVMAAAPSLLIVSDRLLYEPRQLDEALQIRRSIPGMVAQLWFGAFFSPKADGDSWLVTALATFVGRQYLRVFMGQNEARLILKLDMDRACALDYDLPPLSANASVDARLLERRQELAAVKGPLIVQMIDRVVGRQNLQQTLNTMLVEAQQNESLMLLSTHLFFKHLKKISGKEAELRAIMDQYISRAGCPIFNIQYHYNRKRNMTELKLTQTSTAASDINPTAIPPCMGTLTIRIHETEGAFDHVISVDDVAHSYEFAYRSKAKKLRRVYPRNNEETIDDLRPFAEWPVLEEDYTSDSPILWLRADPELAWLASIQVTQTDRSWRHQLFADHDVIAQHQAINALRDFPSRLSALALLRCLGDRRQYFMIRCEAAQALASCSREELDYLGGRYLAQFFIIRHCLGTVAPDANTTDDNVMTNIKLWPGGIPVPRPNNFDHVADYFVLKSIPTAMASVRSTYGIAHVDAIRFLLAILRYNDNDNNPYSDAQYVAATVRALGESYRFCTPNAQRYLAEECPDLVRASYNEIDRLLHRDSLFPSENKLITAACLDALCIMQNVELLEMTLPLFVDHSTALAAAAERQAALDALAQLALGDANVLHYLFAICQKDLTPLGRWQASAALHNAAVSAVADASYRIHFEHVCQRIREDVLLKDSLSGFDAIRPVRDVAIRSRLATFVETVIRVLTDRLEAPTVKLRIAKVDPRKKRPATAPAADSTSGASNGMHSIGSPQQQSSFVDIMQTDEPAPVESSSSTKKPKLEKPVSLLSLVRKPSTPVISSPMPAPMPIPVLPTPPIPLIKIAAPTPPPLAPSTPAAPVLSMKLTLTIGSSDPAKRSKKDKKDKKEKKDKKKKKQKSNSADEVNDDDHDHDSD